MPIRKEEWNSGRKGDTIEARIVDFLKENSRSAFTQTEIVNALYKQSYSSFGELLGSFASFYVVSNALDRLVKEGKVKFKVIEGRSGTDTYYIVS